MKAKTKKAKQEKAFPDRVWCQDCIGEKRHCPWDGKHPKGK